MKRFSATALSLVLLAALVAGCGADATLNRQAETVVIPGLYEASERNEDALSDRKVIKNANIECNADNVSEKYQAIVLWLKDNDGYEFSQNMTKRDAYFRIDAVFKLAPNKLDALIEVIGNYTEIITLRTSTNDITADYFDAQLRLNSKQAALDQYYVMIGKATTIEEILSIQKAINEYTADIESIEGKLLYWDKQVGESTVTLSLFQTNDPTRQASSSTLSFGKMFEYIGDGFLVVINILQWLLIIIISISPLIIIALAVLFIVRFIRRRNLNSKSQ